MRLVPTYVESQEGNWYKNPIVRGRGWFICWDDDEPIELVCYVHTKPGTILGNLKKLGWNLRVISKAMQGQRCFSSDGNIMDNMHPAKSYFLKQENGPLDSMIKEHQGKYRESPRREGTFYSNSLNGNGGRA